MAPHRHHIASTLIVAALLTHCALTVVHAQDTDIRTFQGIRFERPQAPKTYISISPPLSAITPPYTLMLPPDLPTSGYFLQTSAAGPFQLYWSQSPSSSLELVSGTGLRRPAGATEGGVVGGTAYYSNNLQGSNSGSSGASGGKSTIIGGASNETSGYQAAVGGGYSNEVASTLAAVIGGNDNRVSGFRGATLAGEDNLVSGNTSVALGGNGNTQSGNIGFIGAGEDNVGSGNLNTVFGGRLNTNSANIGVIIGGYGNMVSGNRAIVLGGTNNTAAANMGAVGGGLSNNVGTNSSFIGGGASNTSTGAATSSLLGGGSNTLIGSYPSIGGGQSNSASSNHSTVGGGQSNAATTGTHVTSFTGQSNSATSNHASVLGGSSNSVSGLTAVAIGGRSMTISGQNTLGMNGGATAMSISVQNMAVLANMNIWLADNDNTSASLRLFEAYNVSGSIVGANINYVAFKAPASTYNDYSNSYTLPDRVGSGLRFLSVATSPAPTTTDGTLDWIATPTYDVVAHNSAAAGAFPAGTDDADIIRVTSTGAAAARIMTFRNGVTNGLVITVRFSGANAIRVRDADANLDLQGAVDFDMDANDTLTLVWDAASTKWIEIGRTVQN